MQRMYVHIFNSRGLKTFQIANKSSFSCYWHLKSTIHVPSVCFSRLSFQLTWYFKKLLLQRYFVCLARTKRSNLLHFPLSFPLSRQHCDHRCITKQELEDHVRFKHSNKRDFKCPDCQATFKVSSRFLPSGFVSSHFHSLPVTRVL